MQPKFYDIRFHASHLDKIMSLVETQTINDWKQIWLSVNHQVAQQNKKEAEKLAAEAANDAAPVPQVEAAE
jgi:hypothetical protein